MDMRTGGANPESRKDEGGVADVDMAVVQRLSCVFKKGRQRSISLYITYTHLCVPVDQE